MGHTFKIVRDNNNVEALVKAFTESKEHIKDVFCGIRFNDGNLLIIDQGIPFETLCVISKKLDLLIDYRQQDEEPEYEEDEDEDNK